MVILVFTCAVALALVLLYFFHAHWLWHVVSVLVAAGIGLAPPHLVPVPAEWGQYRDMTIGFVFLFLVVWGLGAPAFRKHHTLHAAHKT